MPFLKFFLLLSVFLVLPIPHIRFLFTHRIYIVFTTPGSVHFILCWKLPRVYHTDYPSTSKLQYQALIRCSYVAQLIIPVISLPDILRTIKKPVYIVDWFQNRQRPTFPGSVPPSIISAGELNFCVRDGYRCVLSAIVTGYVLSYLQNWIMLICISSWNHWSSVRPISIGQLHALLHFHLRPINVVVFHGSYLTGEILSCGGLRT